MEEYKTRPPNLWEASEIGDLQRVKELISLKPPNDDKTPSRLPHIWNVHMWSNRPLCLAAANGHVTVVQHLLEHKADVNANDGFPLCWAASEGHTGVVKLLVENGANVHAQDDTALVWAAEEGHTDVVFYLLSRGANYRAQNYAALRKAQEASHSSVLEVFDHYGIEAPASTPNTEGVVASPYKWCNGWC